MAVKPWPRLTPQEQRAKDVAAHPSCIAASCNGETCCAFHGWYWYCKLHCPWRAEHEAERAKAKVVEQRAQEPPPLDPEWIITKLESYLSMSQDLNCTEADDEQRVAEQIRALQRWS